jgi:hypothetical protein
MHAQPSPSAGLLSVGRLSDRIRTRYALAVCTVYGHEHVDGCDWRRAMCPNCGATLYSLALYRNLAARL